MEFLSIAVSNIIGLVIFAMIAAGVFKIFRVASDMHEVKDLLREISRNTHDFTPAGYRAAAEPTPESLGHAVEAESYHQPEIVPLVGPGVTSAAPLSTSVES